MEISFYCNYTFQENLKQETGKEKIGKLILFNQLLTVFGVLGAGPVDSPS